MNDLTPPRSGPRKNGKAISDVLRRRRLQGAVYWALCLWSRYGQAHQGDDMGCAGASFRTLRVGKDAAAASDWLGTLPADSAHAQAVEAYVSKIADTHPELAARWVTSIGDERKRNQQIKNIVGNWLRTDPDSAQAWLRQVSPVGEPKE